MLQHQILNYLQWVRDRGLTRPEFRKNAPILEERACANKNPLVDDSQQSRGNEPDRKIESKHLVAEEGQSSFDESKISLPEELDELLNSHDPTQRIDVSDQSVLKNQVAFGATNLIKIPELIGRRIVLVFEQRPQGEKQHFLVRFMQALNIVDHEFYIVEATTLQTLHDLISQASKKENTHILVFSDLLSSEFLRTNKDSQKLFEWNRSFDGVTVLPAMDLSHFVDTPAFKRSLWEAIQKI